MYRSTYTFNHPSKEEAHEFYNDVQSAVPTGMLHDYRIKEYPDPLAENPKIKKLNRELAVIYNELAILIRVYKIWCEMLRRGHQAVGRSHTT